MIFLTSFICLKKSLGLVFFTIEGLLVTPTIGIYSTASFISSKFTVSIINSIFFSPILLLSFLFLLVKQHHKNVAFVSW